MINILYDGWGNSSTNTFDTLRLFAPDPKHSLGCASARGNYLSCIAIQDYHLNAYTVFSPFTSTIKFDRAQNRVDVIGDNILNTVKFNPDLSVELQLYPQYVFRSDTPVNIQLLPPLLVPPRSDAVVTAGEFDISQWYRPLHTAFIIPKEIDVFEIREGDPLFSVRFATKNNEPVKLTRQTLSETEHHLVNACANVTYIKTGSKLANLYQYFRTFKQSLNRKTQSRCPFHKNNH